VLCVIFGRRYQFAAEGGRDDTARPARMRHGGRKTYPTAGSGPGCCASAVIRAACTGSGRTLGGSPAISAAASSSAELLDHEISAIERVLMERGPLSCWEIQRLLGARYWGPGVFSRALAEAVADGAVRRVGRDTYAAEPSD
jgi:hypothetical protein